jgi:hypothetical protein
MSRRLLGEIAYEWGAMINALVRQRGCWPASLPGYYSPVHVNRLPWLRVSLVRVKC